MEKNNKKKSPVKEAFEVLRENYSPESVQEFTEKYNSFPAQIVLDEAKYIFTVNEASSEFFNNFCKVNAKLFSRKELVDKYEEVYEVLNRAVEKDIHIGPHFDSMLNIKETLEDEIKRRSYDRNNEDIHKSTAAKVFNVPLEEVTKEQRSHAKTVNFGIIYGVSAFGLSNQTNLSRKESAELIDAYYKTYPKLKSFISDQVDFARENGYVETISGRRRYLKDINSANAIVRGGAERNAVNAPIQGSAADIIKIAMINIHKKLKSENWQSKMLLQVHDELVFDVHNSELEKIQPMIKHEMENAFKMIVPLEVEIGMGKNWLEAH
jgi:hypothetical protein